jgi:hypothetical protein
MTKTDTLKKAFLESLGKSLGIVTTASKLCDISRDTHYRWMKEDEDYANSVRDADEVTLDFVESQLHKQIKEGSTTATIFYLKTKGKHRGFIERVEQHMTLIENQLPEWLND